jgi:hypothetical protein
LLGVMSSAEDSRAISSELEDCGIDADVIKWDIASSSVMSERNLMTSRVGMWVVTT